MASKIFVSFLLTCFISLIIFACGDRRTTYEIISTTVIEQRLDNDASTSTAETVRALSMAATIAAGGDITGDLRPAERSAATAQAEATAAAERGETIELIDLDRVELVDDFPDEAPSDIEPVSGSTKVEIMNEGYFEPDVLVIKVGTTVIWSNTQRTPYGTISDDDQTESWKSGPIKRPFGAKEDPTFEYTFTKVGRFTYGPVLAGAAMIAKGRGVIFVVE